MSITGATPRRPLQLLAVLLAATSFQSCAKHDMAGKWACFGAMEITIYEDGDGSFSGKKTTWKPLGERGVRFEHEEQGQMKIFEFKLNDELREGRRTATLSEGGIGLPCVEVYEGIGELLE